jgi:uridine kinase
MTKQELINHIGVNPKKTLIIIRGYSGSGKSTLAKDISYHCELYVDYDGKICEADDYHYDNKGNYNFDLTNLAKAHHYCYGRVLQNILLEYSCIVSNTSTRLSEFEKYIKLANDFNYRVIVIRCQGEYKDIHNVPEEVLKAQKSRFEDYEGEIIYE